MHKDIDLGGGICIGGISDYYEKNIEDALKKRILILNCEIDESILENVALHIIQWNIEDDGLPVEKRKKIKLLISSPGGDCFSGFSLIDVVRNSKTPIVAIGFGLVASMAYYLFIACKERIAFSNTILLLHDGEMSVSNSTSKAKDTMRFLNHMEERTKQLVIKYTKITEEFYDEHYDQEYFMYADEEGVEMGIVDKIIGKDISFDEAFA